MISIEDIFEMLDSSYDGIWITDGTGKILYANSANASLLGVSKKNLEGKTTQQLLDEKIFSNSVILEVLRTKKRASTTGYNYRTKLSVLATATPLFDDRGEIKYIFNNVRNMTELNNLQNLQRDKDEIIRLQQKQLNELKTRYGKDQIIAHNKDFLQVVELAGRVAPFDGSTVLILGESGTGKELIADIIVKNSERRTKPFIKINCGAIPENLLESELFGYEKGAFSGADAKGKKGLFEAANGGTILLDEVGDMPYHLQVKLLRVLQQRQLLRIGGLTPVDLNVRVLAATNRDLEAMVAEKQFREDLYYRLNVVSIQIPPLRKRREDIIPLIHHYLGVFNKKYHTDKSIHSDTIDLFERYDWPGNVRELENLVENLLITTPGDVIQKENLPAKIYQSGTAESLPFLRGGLPLGQAVEMFEQQLIQEALKEHGSLRKAAVALGVNASTISRKIHGYTERKAK